MPALKDSVRMSLRAGRDGANSMSRNGLLTAKDNGGPTTESSQGFLAALTPIGSLQTPRRAGIHFDSIAIWQKGSEKCGVRASSRRSPVLSLVQTVGLSKACGDEP